MKTAKNQITVILLISTLAFIFTMQSIHFPAGQRVDFSDSAVYQYIGHLILAGKVPYVDAFDHKGLYLYFINALGYRISPKIGIWVIDYTFMFINGLLIYRFSRKFCDQPISILILITMISGIGVHYFLGNTPDFFSLTFLFFGINVLANYFIKNDLHLKECIIIGVILGIIIWLKFTMILPILVLCATIFLKELITGNLSFCRRALLGCISGIILASAPAIIWLLCHDALTAMIRDYFGFNLTYRSFHASSGDQIEAYVKMILKPAILLVPICIVTHLIIILRTGSSLRSRNSLISYGFLSFVICLLYCSYTGNPYIHYDLILFPGTVLITVGFCSQYYDDLLCGKRYIIPLIITISVFVYGCLYEKASCDNHWRYSDAQIQEESKLCTYILNNSSEDDSIAIISPARMGYYVATDRLSATRYPYVQAQHLEPEEISADSEFWKEYTHQLSHEKPAIIIIDKYYKRKSLLTVLDPILSDYYNAGDSDQFSVYSLKKDDKQNYYGKVSDESYEDDGVVFTITDDMLEAYKRGDLTAKDIIDRIDQNFPGEEP